MVAVVGIIRYLYQLSGIVTGAVWIMEALTATKLSSRKFSLQKSVWKPAKSRDFVFNSCNWDLDVTHLNGKSDRASVNGRTLQPYIGGIQGGSIIRVTSC
jgi:hypothetical protein